MFSFHLIASLLRYYRISFFLWKILRMKKNNENEQSNGFSILLWTKNVSESENLHSFG